MGHSDVHKWVWFKAECSRHSERGAKSLGRMEEGKRNSGRGRSLLEQVAFKLGLERWVGFQQADVGWGRERPEQRARGTQENARLAPVRGGDWQCSQRLRRCACGGMEKDFSPQGPRVSIW